MTADKIVLTVRAQGCRIAPASVVLSGQMSSAATLIHGDMVECEAGVEYNDPVTEWRRTPACHLSLR